MRLTTLPQKHHLSAKTWITATLLAASCATWSACEPLGGCDPRSWSGAANAGGPSCPHTYDEGQSELSRDLTTQIATSEVDRIAARGKAFSERFSLSIEQGTKLARAINDYNAIQIRSAADVADFAQHLYGINPNRLISAAQKAQLGDNSELNILVNEAADNFRTTPSNMKNIIKDLHGAFLKQQAIDF